VSPLKPSEKCYTGRKRYKNDDLSRAGKTLKNRCPSYSRKTSTMYDTQRQHYNIGDLNCTVMLTLAECATDIRIIINK